MKINKYKIFGLGIKSLKDLKSNLGLNKFLSINGVNKDLRTSIQQKISLSSGRRILLRAHAYNTFMCDRLKNFRGIRNKFKYPVRGQRTKTNAKTKRRRGFN